jgi:DNA polymerase beta
VEQREDGQPGLHRHLDIRFFLSHQFPCGLLYFTGSDFFNTQMRLLALERGYTVRPSASTMPCCSRARRS